MTPTEILIKARELIADPKHWTQGQLARSNTGSYINPQHPSAVCFCSIGALERAAGGEFNDAYYEARARLRDTLNRCIASFNDNHTHAQVLAKFDEAINHA
ncbi:DUF6197 family protein [Aquibium oceanicum]|uniref:Uncharacterized protein n=1 Tax=Aquibium oceanicum TaxID=1670800 RepID=A0A1L3SXM9_9HYPH|nr:hypothetical protein [Aquibium oceanicum]APH74148.1 hypothetical protein BSQ44_24325 [Aquibium oceanicum]